MLAWSTNELIRVFDRLHTLLVVCVNEDRDVQRLKVSLHDRLHFVPRQATHARRETRQCEAVKSLGQRELVQFTQTMVEVGAGRLALFGVFVGRGFLGEEVDLVV